ncbi:MAG: TIGR03032 family protein [Allosphingosinicella sp.]
MGAGVGEVGQQAGKAAQNVNPSEGLSEFLEANAVSLACSSYQTGRLYFLGRGRRGEVSLTHALYPQATGLAADGNSLFLATLTQIVRLENVAAPGEVTPRGYDRMFVPRTFHTTGNVEAHQLAVGADGEIVFVATSYNCLATLSAVHSFRPIWKPRFISAMVAEDRCHLNGLAMDEGRVRYVSAFSKSDERHGWRAVAGNSGLIIDIDSDEIVCAGLSMPHSPRLHAGKLWVANSGTGEFGHVDLASGKFIPLCFAAGYLRGTALFGDYAVLSLSTFRAGRSGHAGLQERLRSANLEAWCGLQIVSLRTGEEVHRLRFEGVITELFDVAVLEAARNPTAIGMQYKDVQDHITVEPLERRI